MLKSSRTNDSRPRIAVAGATGRVGSALLASLASEPLDLVALTRNPDAQRVPSGVSLAVVDFDVPSSLEDALRRADRLFLAHGTSPRQVDNEIAMIDAAVGAGVGYIVKLSAMGPPSRLHPMDWHMQIEAHLATLDIGYTVLRPSTFVDILARAGAQVADDSWGGAAGDGLVNLIDTRDVADVARAALLDDAHPTAQRAYHLTGPRAVSMAEIAEEISRLLGRTVTYQQRSAAEQREKLLASGLNEFVADLLVGLDRLFHDSALAETTSTVENLTGRAPRSVAGWLSENISKFQK
ncbi:MULTISPECIES: SDR family oxidoreductase [unclassified Bradyrhizobium]|uniref:SDR family oxidoreductase n=1 Tax=unclassified Bradyrhizobium TaxID=2631580 RepID=UPI001FF83E7A|nr:MULTISPECIES: SDR family oxidoreductase [unclassified Bradyrhizobium]MCK1712180.1 SDR family oxidoreductase [Bradyrhizobium sp. 143]MCK1729877.1 SDR family oxidoreductase [Bradyrhizobium sp. 142]